MEKGLKEIQNLKNTCYINASIQLLSHLEPIREIFCSIDNIDPNLEILHEFSKLLNEIWGASNTRIIPRSFITTVFRNFSDFLPYTQQDSQEFLMMLIDKLDYQLSKHNPASPTLQKLFQGSYEYNYTCTLCKTNSTSIDYFQQLLLPIPTDANMNNDYDSFLDQEEIKIISTNDYSFWNLLMHPISTKAHLNIYYCIQRFLETQNTEKFCNACDNVTDHSTSITMKDFPEYLIISLKRFKYSIWGNKVSNSVYLSKNLEFGKVKQGGTEENYVLMGIVEHSGLAFRGHYRCYINHYGDWWLLDDKRVRRRTFEQVFKSQAYIALYIKKGKWEQLIRRSRNSELLLGSEFNFAPESMTEGDLTENNEEEVDFSISRELDEYDVIDEIPSK